MGLVPDDDPAPTEPEHEAKDSLDEINMELEPEKEDAVIASHNPQPSEEVNLNTPPSLPLASSEKSTYVHKHTNKRSKKSNFQR